MDLKSFREEKLKIKTQSAFAELIGVEQSNISRWEKDPSSIPYQVIQKILEVTGATFEELTGWEKPMPKPLAVDNNWEKAGITKEAITGYIESVLKNAVLSEEQRKAYIDDLKAAVETTLGKPKIAIVGGSDTGKTTLINSLLGLSGDEEMLADWTRMTSIGVFIKHIKDRPDFIRKEGSVVWIFKSQVGDDELWDERWLNDENYCRKWKIAGGGFETLRSFGTRKGENSDKNAGSAVVFIDAPLLENCDIIDLPGFYTGTENDDNIAFKVTQKADAVIYLSLANGFMRIEDITYLKRNISEIPVWEKKAQIN